MTSDPKAEGDTPHDASGAPLPSRAETPPSARHLPEPSEEEARASHEVRMLLSQARREALMSLQRLEDVERRAAMDQRLQDDRLHLRLDAIGESRRRLIAVLPLSPGGGPAPLPPRAEENDAPRKTPSLFDTPDALGGRINRPQGGGRRPKRRGRGLPALPRRLALLACLALLVVFAAYVLGTLQRPNAQELGSEPSALPGNSAPASETRGNSAVARS